MNKILRSIAVTFSAGVLSASTLAAGGGGYSGGASADSHFHPKGKPPSAHTLKVLQEAHKTLPFSDTRDFDEEKKGFIAAPDFWVIKGEKGNVVWDMERYKFFLEDKAYPSMPIIKMGLRPVRSETLPHIGAKRNSSRAAIATSKPRWRPLAPSFSM